MNTCSELVLTKTADLLSALLFRTFFFNWMFCSEFLYYHIMIVAYYSDSNKEIKMTTEKLNLKSNSNN